MIFRLKLYAEFIFLHAFTKEKFVQLNFFGNQLPNITKPNSSRSLALKLKPIVTNTRSCNNMVIKV